MKNLRLPFLLLAFVVAFNACKKKDDPAPPTKTELLTAKTWKRTGLTVDPRLPADTTGTAFLPADLFAYYATASVNGSCINDNTRKFDKAFKFTFEQGATKCDNRQDQVYASGTWSLSSDENTLALSYSLPISSTIDLYEDFGLAATNYTISELTATSLKITYIIPTQSATYTFTETLSNQ
jgi:hypothetical protein